MPIRVRFASMPLSLLAQHARCLETNVYLLKGSATITFTFIAFSNGLRKDPLRIAHSAGKNGWPRIFEKRRKIDLHSFNFKHLIPIIAFLTKRIILSEYLTFVSSNSVFLFKLTTKK